MNGSGLAVGRWFKAVAGGNDFLVVDVASAREPSLDAPTVRALCDRHAGLGADGLIALLADETATAGFALWNADGSRAALSGNGSRCAARVLHALGRAEDGRVTLTTDEGRVEARVLTGGDGRPVAVAVDLPRPRDARPDLALPARSPAPAGDYLVVGVPYLALRVEDPEALDLPRLAPPLRRLASLPDGANVAFHSGRASPDEAVALRTWERGVEGETLSSGTGCAAVALAVLRAEGALARDGVHAVALQPRAPRPVAVTVTVARGGVDRVVLEGDATLVAELVPSRELVAAIDASSSSPSPGSNDAP